MKIDHIAIWTRDLDKVRDFYVRYFGAVCSSKYENSEKKFSSYFLSFPGESTRIELMHNPEIREAERNVGLTLGLTHLAVSAGSRDQVNRLTEQLRTDGYKIIGEPRVTGDGYYESVVEDCEGNRLEITE
ncbi:VOC family protein [Thermophagus xiamenensis]|uniref:Lactoylglutathione lyase n=1 Tax=Thermophagus xiamenensis TaxID=385682 RepID=A0A1I1VUA6_9BACT|nr:VOC family protein [Thermophagus xiamenensis]SFD85638.1 lactoylglutathione lyase [Thermophagus xiamenensis]